jgi:hypothetical protein
VSQTGIQPAIVRIAPFPAEIRQREPLPPGRVLQLALAVLWLLDGALQFQPFMFSKSFPAMLAATASGNPAIVSVPITWNASLIGQHAVLLNSMFAITQLLLGIGIAIRPLTRVALAASICWALGVWWFGEGLGGVLAGTANTLTGAPGAVLLYAVLAVLLWSPSRPLSHHGACLVWLVIWLSLAWFAFTPADRAPQSISTVITSGGTGEPRWLAALDRPVAALTSGQGLYVSAGLAVVLALIAAGIYLPPRFVKVPLVAAIAVAALIWVFGEAFGGLLTGTATDPNSGPLLALLALTYWPARVSGGDPGGGDRARDPRYRGSHERPHPFAPARPRPAPRPAAGSLAPTTRSIGAAGANDPAGWGWGVGSRVAGRGLSGRRRLGRCGGGGR